MTVYFQGKAMSKCPRGYTLCAEIKKDNLKNCIAKSTCESMVAQRKKDKPDENKKKTEKKPEISDKQKISAFNFIQMCKQGLIVNADNGSIEGKITRGNLPQLIANLKIWAKSLPEELLSQVGGGEFISLFRMLKNEQLPSSTMITLTGQFFENSLGLQLGD